VFYDSIILSIKFHNTEPNNKDAICHLDLFRGQDFVLNNVLMLDAILFYTFHKILQ